jgi:hypothetical protein
VSTSSPPWSGAAAERVALWRCSPPTSRGDHNDALVPGERGVLLCVALDQRVAKIILDYAEASFERSPILKQLIANRRRVGAHERHFLGGPPGVVPQIAWPDLRCGDRRRACLLVRPRPDLR